MSKNDKVLEIVKPKISRPIYFMESNEAKY